MGHGYFTSQNTRDPSITTLVHFGLGNRVRWWLGNKLKLGVESMGNKNMRLEERDFLILDLVHRFKFCLGRHIKVLAGFSGARASDRRLKLLVDVGYLQRKKYLYGIPYLYTLTHKGRILLSANKREDKIRIERIAHDIYVLDSLIFFLAKYNISLADIESEKELHIKDGFGTRKHQPDFIFTKNNKRYAVEIELNPKAKDRIENNIRDNYLNYDEQIWIAKDNKIFATLQKFQNDYSNIEIMRLESILDYGKHRNS